MNAPDAARVLEPPSRTGREGRRATLLQGAFGRLMERGLARISETPLTRGNRVDLLVDGPRAYPAMLGLMEDARTRIHFENYIIEDDEVGRRFAEVLARRARDGVQVRVLYDWLGSFGTSGEYWNELREAGCEVRPFGKALTRRSAGLLGRDHRKLLVVDGRSAITGGLCIGDDWQGKDGEECWRDTAVLLGGPVVRELDRTFARMWVRAGGEALPTLRVEGDGQAGSVAVRVVDGRPRDVRTYRLYQFLATVAERTLYITMAYPLLPLALRRALAAAARAGVDVRMLVPSRSDLPIVNEAARALYGSLLGAGVRIYEWEGPMLHAKTAVADGRFSIVGSSNLEPWGLLGNYELDVEIQDEDFGGRLHAQFLEDLERSQRVRLAAWRGRPLRRRVWERLASALLWLPIRMHGA